MSPADGPGPAAPGGGGPEWFDSHCHVQDFYRTGGRAGPERAEAVPGGPEALFARAAAAGVTRAVCVGTDAATSTEALELVRGRRARPRAVPAVWATAGLHPHEARTGLEEVRRVVEDAVAAADGALVAVGECGLDYYYEHSPRPVQREMFAAQIALARQHDLALVIHARDAWDDLFGVIAAEPVPERTVLHCFTGGPHEATRCLDAGMVLSFSGIVTFKSASDVRDAAVLCPLDRLLVETDAPFLAPVPHRGQDNEPAYVALVGAAIAAVKGVDPADVARVTGDTAAATFRIGEGISGSSLPLFARPS
jgi:TatD DNase family protein